VNWAHFSSEVVAAGFPCEEPDFSHVGPVPRVSLQTLRNNTTTAVIDVVCACPHNLQQDFLLFISLLEIAFGHVLRVKKS